MSLGHAITTARLAEGLTQAQLAGRSNVTQAALSRYENDLREPSSETLEQISNILGLTTELLHRGKRMRGALAVDAHMRRRQSARPTRWRQLEAKLNVYRIQVQKIMDELNPNPENTIPHFDPFETEPAAAARMVRSQWRMPIGPVAA